MFDVVIQGGMVVDGTGNPWRRAEIGVRQGRIAAVGRLDAAEAEERMSATGRVLCPGFIDMHSHSDLMLIKYPEAEIKVRQGVTLEILGVDGLSVMPITPEHRTAWRRRLHGLLGDPDIEWTWGKRADD